MNILIVDDEKGNRNLLKKLVKNLNLFGSVRVACDLEQARNILNDQDDLEEWIVLSDIRLSPGSGPDLKKDFPQTPFIFMTGFCGEKEERKAKKSSWNGQIMGKPFTKDDLEKNLRELVGCMKKSS